MQLSRAVPRAHERAHRTGSSAGRRVVHHDVLYEAGMVTVPDTVRALELSDASDPAYTDESGCDFELARYDDYVPPSRGRARTPPQSRRAPYTPQVRRDLERMTRDDALNLVDATSRPGVHGGDQNCWLHLYETARKSRERREAAKLQGRFVLESIDRQLMDSPAAFTPEIGRRSRSLGRSGRHSSRGRGVWDKLNATPSPSAATPQQPGSEYRFIPHISEYARKMTPKKSVVERLVEPRVASLSPPLRHSQTPTRSSRPGLHQKLYERGEAQREKRTANEGKRQARETREVRTTRITRQKKDDAFRRLFGHASPTETYPPTRSRSRSREAAPRAKGVDFIDAQVPNSLWDDSDAPSDATVPSPSPSLPPDEGNSRAASKVKKKHSAAAVPTPEVPATPRTVSAPSIPVAESESDEDEDSDAGAALLPSRPQSSVGSHRNPPAPATQPQAKRQGFKRPPDAPYDGIPHTPSVGGTPRPAMPPPGQSVHVKTPVVAAAPPVAVSAASAPPFSPEDDDFLSDEDEGAGQDASLWGMHPVPTLPAEHDPRLRFRLGDAVLCATTGGRVLGFVQRLREEDKGNVYRISTQLGDLVAKEDTDLFVKSAGEKVALRKLNGAVGIVYADTRVVDVGPNTAAHGRIPKGANLTVVHGRYVRTHDEVAAALRLAPEVDEFDIYFVRGGDGPRGKMPPGPPSRGSPKSAPSTTPPPSVHPPLHRDMSASLSRSSSPTGLPSKQSVQGSAKGPPQGSSKMPPGAGGAPAGGIKGSAKGSVKSAAPPPLGGSVKGRPSTPQHHGGGGGLPIHSVGGAVPGGGGGSGVHDPPSQPKKKKKIPRPRLR